MTTHTKMPTKALSMGAAALVLGSTFATGGAIVASPDSPFGLIQSAEAATGNMVQPSKYTVTPIENNTNGQQNLTLDFTGVQVNPGDYFTLQLGIGNGATPTADPNAVLQQYAPDTFSTADHVEGGKPEQLQVIASVLDGKELNFGIHKHHYSNNNGVTEIKSIALPDGTIIAQRESAVNDGLYRFVFTDAVANRADISVGLPINTSNNSLAHVAGGATVDNAALRASTGSDHISYFPSLFDTTITVDEWKQLPNGSPWNFKFAEYPTSVYLNNKKIAEGTSALRSSYVKRERSDTPPITRVSGDLRDSGEFVGGWIFSTPTRATQNDVGVRQTITTQFSESVLQNFDLTKLDNVNNWGYFIIYNTPVPDGTGFWQATPEEVQAIYGTTTAPSSPTLGGDYDVRIESINKETGTVVWSWVPKHVGETLSLNRYNIRDNSQATVMNAKPEYLKRVVESGNFLDIGENRENTVTQTQTSANAEPRVISGGFRYTISLPNADALFLPSVGNYEDTTKFQTPVSQNLLESAQFPGSAYQSSTITAQATNGTVKLDANGTAVYTPKNGFAGTDTVKFTVTDQNGKVSNEGTWTINVTPPAPPTGQGESDTTVAPNSVTRDLKANDTFPESPYKSTTITKQPTNGKVVRNADGTYTYTPNAGWVGTDTVVYTQTDEFGNTTDELTWTIKVVAPAAPVAQPDTVNVEYQGTGSVSLTTNDSANGTGNRIKPETAEFTDGAKERTVDGIKVSINNDGSFNVNASGSTHSGTYELEYNVYDIYGTPAKAKVTVNVGEPTIGISVKALIDGQDANDKDNPVILTPGDYTVTYQITNPNKYPLDASQLKLANGGQQVTIPEGTVIKPGKTAEVTGTVTLEKQGAVDVDAQATGTYSYTHNGEAKTITANADDPAHIKALVKAIDIEDDTNVIIAKDGATVSGNLFENDTPDADYPFLDETFEWIVPEGVEHTLSEDGNTVELPNAIVEYLGNGDYKVTYKDGVTDFKIPDLGYNISDALGDITDPATLSVKYAMVDLEVFVQDENGQWRDADDETNPVVFSDEGRKNFKFTIVNNGEVELDENLVKQLLDDTFEDVALDGTIVPGGNVEFTKAMNLTKGFYSFSFGTSNNTGAEDTDDVNLEVEKKEEPQQVPPTIIVNVPPTVVNTPVDIKITNNNGNNITIKNEGGSGNDTVTERVVGSPATPTKVKVNTGNDGDLAMVAGSGLAALFGAWVVAGRKRAGRMFRKDS